MSWRGAVLSEALKQISPSPRRDAILVPHSDASLRTRARIGLPFNHMYTRDELAIARNVIGTRVDVATSIYHVAIRSQVQADG